MRLHVLLVVGLAFACSAEDPEVEEPVERGFEPPVAMNAESPVRYPPDLYGQGTEGTVLLRLFVSEDGTVIPDSTIVAEGSGEAAFDSAAVAGVDGMRFAPARRDGQPVPTAFLQPIHFRLPEGTAAGGS